MLTTKKLIEGAEVISSIAEREILSIEFEDGSGFKFNVRFINDVKSSFWDIKSLLTDTAKTEKPDSQPKTRKNAQKK